MPPWRIPDSSSTSRPRSGDAEARAAVSVYYGAAIPPEHIVLTASTSEAYALLFKVLGDPGDRVLVPAPSYPLFEYLASLESVEAVPYPCLWEGDGWCRRFRGT